MYAIWLVLTLFSPHKHSHYSRWVFFFLLLISRLAQPWNQLLDRDIIYSISNDLIRLSSQINVHTSGEKLFCSNVKNVLYAKRRLNRQKMWFNICTLWVKWHHTQENYYNLMRKLYFIIRNGLKSSSIETIAMSCSVHFFYSPIFGWK